jgi:hypothetical protein
MEAARAAPASEYSRCQASERRRSVRSVCAPTHSRTSPSAPSTGMALTPTWRYSPSWRRRRYSDWYSVPVPTACSHPRRTRARSSGCTQSSQPQPLASANGWPVKRVHPACSAASSPPGGVVHTNSDVAATSERKRSSLSRTAASTSRERSRAFTVATSSRGSTGCVR